MTVLLTFDFSPDEARDDHGRWTSGGGDGSSPSTDAIRDVATKYAAPGPEMEIADKIRDRGGWGSGQGAHERWQASLAGPIESVYNGEAKAGSVPGITDPDELKAAVEAHAKDMLAGADLRIRVPADTLDNVLADGEFKNQFATGDSQGWFNPYGRAEAEARMFGIPNELSPEQWADPRRASLEAADHPKYGYLYTGPPEEEKGGQPQYGPVVVNLKDDVKARTTFTTGDSLSEVDQPSFVDDPSWRSFKSPSFAMKADTPQDVVRGHPGQYMEAQIHGPLRVSDIRDVVLPEVADPDLAEELLGPTKAQLDSLHIPYRVSPGL